MKLVRTIVLTVALLATLAYFYTYVSGKEHLMREGELVLFELAPLDPRSLMQGDYMQLRYSIGRYVPRDTFPDGGYLVFSTDGMRVAHYIRVQSEPEPLAAGEHVIRFYRRASTLFQSSRIELGSSSYFFQEGEGEKYAEAQYGGIRVDDRGDAVLVGLYDIDGQPIR